MNLSTQQQAAVQRTGQDVPGWLIPQLYQDYLRTGATRQMNRVMYHNLYDVLSMVTLAMVFSSGRDSPWAQRIEPV